jgi:hypothetical protein
MKGVLSWLIRWARRAGTRDFYPPLAALGSSEQKFFFSSPYTISIDVYPPAQQPAWEGSRAGPPVSECMSPGGIWAFSQV